MKVLITGAKGFLGKNLYHHLSVKEGVEIFTHNSDNDLKSLIENIRNVDFIFHLAGVNRTSNPQDFIKSNQDLTRFLCEEVRNVAVNFGKRIPILLASSTQAHLDNPYGKSKKEAEDSVLLLAKEQNIPVFIFRLTNIFGKWSRPNYNSVVATFCYNISRGIPIRIDDLNARLNLVYVDDVVNQFGRIFDEYATFRDICDPYYRYLDVEPCYNLTVGGLEKIIRSFDDSRNTLVSERVGSGVLRALYATYMSYLPPKLFSYPLAYQNDSRGIFVEVLKTIDSGQFSYFTAGPGVTRGEHYHHSKIEKFVVIVGEALFRFHNIISGERYQISANGAQPLVVESIPGWALSIANIGQSDLVVMLWANGEFDPSKADDFAARA